MRRIVVVFVSVSLAVATWSLPAGAQGATVQRTVAGRGPALMVPLGGSHDTVCDPARWDEGPAPCPALLVGTFRGTMTRSDDGSVQPVLGWYHARVTVTTFRHSPPCLEVWGGPVTYTIVGAHGRPLGVVVSLLDESDSEACQALAPSTDRSFFLRSDPARGTGVFAGDVSGTTNLTGDGHRLGRSSIYRYDADFLSDVSSTL